MRKITSAAALATAAVLTLSLAACAGGASSTTTTSTAAADTPCGGAVGGSITWYTSADAETAQKFVDEFISMCDVDVQVQSAPTLTLWQRFQSEQAAGVHDADVLSISSPALAAQAIAGDLVVPLPDDVVANIPAPYVDKDKYWFSNRVQVISIIYNTNEVAAKDVPTSYQDLLDPKWAGKVSIADASKSTSAIAHDWEMVNTPGIGMDWFEAFAKQRPGLFGQSGQQINSIVQGEYAMGLTVSGSAWTQIEAGAPIAEVIPEEGAGQLFNQNMKVATTDNELGAEAFLRFLASPEGMEISMRVTMDLPPIPGIAPYPEGRLPLDKIKLLKHGGQEQIDGEPALAEQMVELFGKAPE
ncbi:MAG: extracellular solute-binding protein family 1 [Schumannella sp.]|nr:extracellular solute-binding protein family 1 [Schumannella sp.]